MESMPLTKISSEPGTIAGWRSVTKETILEKVKAYIHRASPEWPGPKMIFRPSGQGEEFFFVSGHQRVVALHKYLQWCHATDASPHDFLLGMAASVPCAVQEIGAQEACMEGLKRCVQTVHGTTGFTAFSLYVLMRTHKINFPEFKASCQSGPEIRMFSHGSGSLTSAEEGSALLPLRQLIRCAASTTRHLSFHQSGSAALFSFCQDKELRVRLRVSQQLWSRSCGSSACVLRCKGLECKSGREKAFQIQAKFP